MIAKNITINFGLLMILSLAFYIFSSLPAAAQYVPSGDLNGYAWSSTIGWISLNCLTGSAAGGSVCGTSNYKVSINSDKTITGYAWSSNVGWIKFGSLSTFPTGSGTTAVNARVLGTYPNYTFDGWTRACAGTTTGTCSTMADNASGWDGWISLKGTRHQIQTDNSGLVNSSYAWGSTIVGWVDWFTRVLWLKPAATLSVGTCVVPEGASVCNAPVTWNIQYADSPNVRNNSTNSHYSSSTSGTSVLRSIRLGSNIVVARDNDYVLTSFTRTLTSANCITGTVIMGSTCEFPPPVLTMTVSRPIARKGDTVTTTWTITPNPTPASSTCTLSGPGLAGTVTGDGTVVSAALSSKSQFSISCSGPYGSVEAVAGVDIVPSAQEV